MNLYERLVAKKEKLSIVGLGYVGMPIAIAFAKKVTKTINLKFCSVDLYIENNKIKVLETNSIVSMNSFANYSKENYNKTKQIFLEAVNASFENI